MRLLVGIILAAALAAQAAAQEYRRIDPTIDALLRTRAAVVGNAPSLSAASEASVHDFPLGLAVEPADPGGSPRLGVFVRLSTPGALDELRSAGAEIGTVIGDIATARVPLDAISRLAASPAVRSMEAARVVTVRHDSSMKAIGVDELRQVVGESWTGATGQGAIVAIYDTGLDLEHPDFITPNGETRVLGVWDQTNQTRRPPPGFNRGFYCSREAVQQRIEGDDDACPQEDNHGHGTHVAGSAAGDGSATGSGGTAFQYAGVAPNAELLIVKGGPGVFFEDLIVEGLRWLKDESERLGKPVVVNLSLGGQFGPHDGTRLYEQAIDALSGPGFVVVVSSGNSGSNANTLPDTEPLHLIHARGFATETTPRDFEVIIPQYSPSGNRCNGNFVAIDFWYEASEQLTIAVIRPNGTAVSAETGQHVMEDADGGNIDLDNASGGIDPENGDREAHISIDGCGPSGETPEPGTWLIRVTPAQPGGGTPYDMWIYRSQLGSNLGGGARGGAGFDNQFIVGSPGNATEAITVGAFVTRLCWPTETRPNVCYVDREEIGDLARFSGGGPRRDGVLKPEITAPGLGIASARSSDASTPDSRTIPDGVHWVLEGTSMAAPHVTGAIAVLFGSNPQLSAQDIRDVFETTAVDDAFTAKVYPPAAPFPSALEGPLPEHWWGYGKLNVRNALIHLSGDEPAVLALEARSAVPDTTTIGNAGRRLPLLRLSLASQGFEPIRVLQLVFQVEGVDPGARLVLARDENGNGQFDTSDAIVGSAPAPLDGGKRRVEVTPESLVVPEFSEIELLVGIELSGAAPNGTDFQVTFAADETRSVGTKSQVQNELAISTQPLESGVATTTVLQDGQKVSLSENPVRSSEVIFNFIEPPATAALYTVNGRRIVDLLGRIGSGELRLAWDLTNDEGSRVAPGVYLLVFSVQGELFRQKLIVLTPRGAPDEE